MVLKKKTKNDVEETNRRSNERSFEDMADDLVNASSVTARRWAARDIASHEGAVEVLLNALDNEPESVVFEAILDSLEKIGTDDVVLGLLPLLRSENAAHRNGAIEVLQSMPEHVALHIIELLNDTDSDVRIFAVDILQVLAHPDTPKWLMSVLKDETHINVVATVVDRLAEVGTLDMIDEIAALKDRFVNEHYLHFAIDTAISRIKGE